MPSSRLRALSAAGAALTIVLACAACSSTPTSGSSTSSAPSSSSTAAANSGTTATPAASSANGKKLTYVGFNDPVYGTIYCGAQTEAKRLGATISKQFANDFTASSQIPVLNAALGSNPDGILISPTDPNALYAPIKAATAAGTPVVAADNTLINTDALTAQSLVNNEASGILAAQYLAKKADGKKVKVGLMGFTKGGSAAADAESTGFINEIKKYSNITYVGATYNGGGIADTTKDANGMFARNPDMFGMFGNESTATAGIVAAAQQRGIKPVVVAGYGAQFDNIVSFLKTGQVSAITDFPFRQVGVNGVDQIVAKINGTTVPKTLTESAVIYTKADLNKPGVILGSDQAKC